MIVLHGGADSLRRPSAQYSRHRRGTGGCLQQFVHHKDTNVTLSELAHSTCRAPEFRHTMPFESDDSGTELSRIGSKPPASNDSDAPLGCRTGSLDPSALQLGTNDDDTDDLGTGTPVSTITAISIETNRRFARHSRRLLIDEPLRSGEASDPNNRSGAVSITLGAAVSTAKVRVDVKLRRTVGVAECLCRARPRRLLVCLPRCQRSDRRARPCWAAAAAPAQTAAQCVCGVGLTHVQPAAQRRLREHFA